MNYTNLNIISGDKSFKYIVEYFDDKGLNTNEIKYLKNDFGIFLFNDNIDNILYEKNYYDKITDEVLSSDILPNTYNISSFDLFFPRYSVETYNTNVSYVITINTWINGVCVFLGSKLINRNNALAPENGVRKFLNDEYYEYIRINCVDPFNLIYANEWKDFRNVFCNEPIYNGGLQKNNTASNINITLTPVKNINGLWVKMDEYDSSQSAILLTNKNDSNYFAPVLTFKNENGNPEFNCKLRFNEVYENNLEEYLAETYQIQVNEDFKIKYCFIIGDKENPYKYKENHYNTAIEQSSFYLNDFCFESWDDFIDGMSANVIVIIQRFDEDILVLSSNRVFITQEEFRYLLQQPIRNVDLQNIDMELKNYNVVNVIENKIVTVDRPNDTKANIVKPIFIKVQDSDTIRLHNSVTENICLNLDAYKNKVEAFILKIGDMNFYEIGRVNSGIIFKVIGTNLPEQNEGIYYILNEDGELVTNGKYKLV